MHALRISASVNTASMVNTSYNTRSPSVLALVLTLIHACLLGATSARTRYANLVCMSPAERRKHKPRSPQSPLRADARPLDAEPASTALRATRFQLAGDDYVVLSYPHAAFTAPAALTSTEQAIFSALLSGQSNPQIAASRGRALRTIANQVAAIFQKLGVSSRAELIAKFSARP